ncbi:MAG: sugar ABC transporter ATP-binding protein [Planctomycetaceae bacterium]|nr:sugar ABC transporter ATP-binding protein [Planctomycetaceae bacterium]
MSESEPAPLLSVDRVTKRFPGVTALKDVCLSLQPGEVLALIGENGAGKSTLMKILAGVQLPDEGTIRVAGNSVTLDSVHTSQSQGIALIHQELNLSGNLDVGANIFLGREPRRFGLIDKDTIRKKSRALLKRLGLNVDPDTLVDHLPIGQQQLVEIARALSVDARVLIMDEPTSSLSQHETERLMQVVKELRCDGVSVIYISHRLREVMELADRVTVFRDGENAGELTREEMTHDSMVQLMVGRDVSQFYSRQPHPPGDVALEVSAITSPLDPGQRLSFQVRQGEIVGVSGLVGAGRSEMLEVVFGVRPTLQGHVKVGGRQLRLRSPVDAVEAGLALVPEDRKKQGVILELAVRTNIGLAGLRRHRRLGAFLNEAQEKADSAAMVKKLRIKTPGDLQTVQFLSGGNQQKVVLGKWLAMEPTVLLLDEPTRGIDIGAKHEIYTLMDQLAAAGMAILFVSSEMEEIIGMSDRVIVMHEGRITGELPREQLTEQSVMQLATGG